MLNRMYPSSKRIFVATLVPYLLATGCVSKSVYLKQVQRGDQLKNTADSQSAQIQDLQTQLQGLQANISALNSDKSDLLKTLEAKKGELNQRLTELTKQNQDLTQQLRDTQQAKDAEIA